MSEWKPIETAPSPQSIITLLVFVNGTIRMWNKAGNNWFVGLGEADDVKHATHWMPLPDKPDLIAEKVAAIINAESDVFIKARDAACKSQIRWIKK